ncbi:ABC transporter permease [Catelliglobosispora koreensis]|uniref:ABC transporter permease n=1 Tax=Catelliglobosispora koreensis TaxID=129052 RepID=UPI0003775B10|nr:ABC transporter permease [Catelliglobosispora koreensis]
MSSPPNPWFSWSYVENNVDSLLAALQEHILLTVAAVLIAAAVGIPLAVLAYRVPWLATPTLAATATLYTIPSLALFAFLAPFTGLSVRTVLIGLVLYALILILRNTLTGFQQVPSEVQEVARGMGYSKMGMLRRIELPIALPSIMTGLRIATVSTVALVTVGEIVGIGGLGNLILLGFRTNFYRAQIMTASLLTVALALVLDLLLIFVGWLLMPWARKRRTA